MKRFHELLSRGDTIHQMMQVTGEEGISLEDFVTWQKSLLLDLVYLQQDAFDEVDAAVPRERQLASFRLLNRVIERDYPFKDKDEARAFFTRLTGLYRNWNYAPPASPDYQRYWQQIEALAAEGGAESLRTENLEAAA